MSAPAAKALAEPVRTMAEMEGSLSRVEVQVLSSSIRGEKRAFRALGLLRVTVLGSHVSCCEQSWIAKGLHTQSDTRSGSAELNVLIVVFGRRCRVRTLNTRSYSLDEARRERSDNS
jgi:hypothetical protein